jgi:cell wall assembly regulator SMI1
MKFEITTLAESINEDDLSTFETDYGIVLPSNYRKFILKKNGGLVERNKFIHKFLSIKNGNLKVEDVVRFHQINEQNIPAGYLPIASDHSSNPIVYNMQEGDGYGKIILIDMDMDMVESVLANSLEEFLGVEKIEDL